jgi:long-chain acyl-CoA synthetase
VGRFDSSGHLQLFGRKKNMIVTEGGKNIYPEDIETAFDGLLVKEYCIFAANYIWPAKTLGKEMLILVLRLEQGQDGQVQELTEALKQDIIVRNRRLPDFKRVGGCLVWEKDFPRTAAMKIKRIALAEEIRKVLSRAAVVDI